MNNLPKLNSHICLDCYGRVDATSTPWWAWIVYALLMSAVCFTVGYWSNTFAWIAFWVSGYLVVSKVRRRARQPRCMTCWSTRTVPMHSLRAKEIIAAHADESVLRLVARE